MELELENDLVIQCNVCGKVYVIDKDSLDVDTYSYERQMGEEIEYNFNGEIQCDNCKSNITYMVRGFEYPVGWFNYDDFECYGAKFTQSPAVGVHYYEFDYDDCDEDYICLEINNTHLNIEKILHNNEEIYNLMPREFEEMVAEIFSSKGFEVKLTPETRDGGCDIIATHNVAGLPYMVLIECKKYNKKNKVGISLVRSLLGVQTDHKANKAVLVTTSTFTKDARDFAERQNQLITLLDYNDLLQMIHK